MSLSPTPPVQMLGYLKRNPALTREQFYAYWKEKHGPLVLPFFRKHGVIRYQQVHASGYIVPNVDPDSKNTEPIEFDGIAMTLVPNVDGMTNRLEDPYYTGVIMPDEERLLDPDAPGRGIVAIFFGHSESIIEPAIKA